MATFPAYAITQSKRRDETPIYRDDQPLAGSSYSVKEFTGYVRSWQFDVAVPRRYAQYFDAWFYENENEWFDFSVATESGIETLTVHFTEGGIPQLKSEQADVLTYSMEVTTRGIT